jgi:hypothetical protein
MRLENLGTSSLQLPAQTNPSPSDYPTTDASPGAHASRLWRNILSVKPYLADRVVIKRSGGRQTRRTQYMCSFSSAVFHRPIPRQFTSLLAGQSSQYRSNSSVCRRSSVHSGDPAQFQEPSVSAGRALKGVWQRWSFVGLHETDPSRKTHPFGTLPRFAVQCR